MGLHSQAARNLAQVLQYLQADQLCAMMYLPTCSGQRKQTLLEGLLLFLHQLPGQLLIRESIAFPAVAAGACPFPRGHVFQTRTAVTTGCERRCVGVGAVHHCWQMIDASHLPRADGPASISRARSCSCSSLARAMSSCSEAAAAVGGNSDKAGA